MHFLTVLSFTCFFSCVFTHENIYPIQVCLPSGSILTCPKRGGTYIHLEGGVYRNIKLISLRGDMDDMDINLDLFPQLRSIRGRGVGCRRQFEETGILVNGKVCVQRTTTSKYEPITSSITAINSIIHASAASTGTTNTANAFARLTVTTTANTTSSSSVGNTIHNETTSSSSVGSAYDARASTSLTGTLRIIASSSLSTTTAYNSSASSAFYKTLATPELSTLTTTSTSTSTSTSVFIITTDTYDNLGDVPEDSKTLGIVTEHVETLLEAILSFVVMTVCAIASGVAFRFRKAIFRCFRGWRHHRRQQQQQTYEIPIEGYAPPLPQSPVRPHISNPIRSPLFTVSNPLAFELCSTPVMSLFPSSPTLPPTTAMSTPISHAKPTVSTSPICPASPINRPLPDLPDNTTTSAYIHHSTQDTNTSLKVPSTISHIPHDSQTPRPNPTHKLSHTATPSPTHTLSPTPHDSHIPHDSHTSTLSHAPHDSHTSTLSHTPHDSHTSTLSHAPHDSHTSTLSHAPHDSHTSTLSHTPDDSHTSTLSHAPHDSHTSTLSHAPHDSHTSTLSHAPQNASASASLTYTPRNTSDVSASNNIICAAIIDDLSSPLTTPVPPSTIYNKHNTGKPDAARLLSETPPPGDGISPPRVERPRRVTKPPNKLDL